MPTQTLASGCHYHTPTDSMSSTNAAADHRHSTSTVPDARHRLIQPGTSRSQNIKDTRTGASQVESRKPGAQSQVSSFLIESPHSGGPALRPPCSKCAEE
ncbi:hypothetical protein JRQ81_002969 [Phrynocephalus forsythii]|uniref:Uncharacterized protein n=1 Tax=Phrynocephalus forsythii TaxID=171643 RepID=A0A9Q0XJB5_9SAUR|nr:hypothetical protein JRQ81_002969 [Phrynocephalus forsythii]